MMQKFADSGEPGERFGGDKAALTAALQLPAGLDASLCEAAGLVASGCCKLLPSFLHLIRQLKSEGRSFSLSFRTFGGDLAVASAAAPFLLRGYLCFPPAGWCTDRLLNVDWTALPENFIFH